ncbi:MAG TPA: alanine--tRNA ligase [Acidimicrobiales bacterium]|nr:alanine--tRNA ligase [Acidimicrobiales bacterium]
MDADTLRRAFTEFFVERGHTAVGSAGLIPHHPTAPLLTNAGMNQFIPYFVGEEPPPWPRATTVQKCFRTQDIDIVGTTTRHLTFFEMLGNFSFGDYFKADAISFAWELVTEVLGLDPDRLWATVHLTDDEAERIWVDEIGLLPERVQRLDEDNWWAPGKKTDQGPCGPCSEIYFDKGEGHGAAGGPAGGGPERYVEIWNLVFMQFNRQADGSLVELPRKNIDTGAGLERILPILQGTTSVFDTDVLRPLVAAAEAATGRTYGGGEEAVDVSLRILADHARAMTFLVNDGVLPSNEARGYVLRRIIRRAVRHAFQLGVSTTVTPGLVEATVATMAGAYPDLSRNSDFVAGVVLREEERFRRTLEAGMGLLEAELEGEGDAKLVSGEVAFKLHDTFGFPIELTSEIAAERGLEVDVAGFETAMAAQRQRARQATAGRTGGAANAYAYRELLEQFGTTEFTGYAEYESKARVLAVLPGPTTAPPAPTVEIFLDRTPFYAEGGGQVGDTGLIVTDTGRAEVLDTTAPVPGLHRHSARVTEGAITPGQEALATIDGDRRDAIRRNHTGTHLLHWALREVVGTHVKQQGSLVAPDYLRFDFSNDGPVPSEQLRQVENLVNERILANEPVRAYETSKSHAEELGAIAFFGDKYGEFVRVVESGSRSLELCGGTHVHALGMIGPVKITSEASIGANMRRVFALTGTASLAKVREDEQVLERAAHLLRAEPMEVPGALERLLERQRAAEAELRSLRTRAAGDEARTLAATAAPATAFARAPGAGEGTGAETGAGAGPLCVVARRDGLPQDQMRDLALAVRGEPQVQGVVLIGTPDGQRVALVAAVEPGTGLDAPALVSGPARLLGGGGGGRGDVAVAGGKDPSRIDEALAAVRATLGLADA